MSEFIATEFQHRKFERGACYHHKIIKVTDERKRTFNKPGTNRTYYVFDIFSQNTKGEKFASEYLSPGPTQNVFIEGVTQWFKCVQPGKVADEVEPCDEPEQYGSDRYFQPNDKGDVLPKNTLIQGTKASVSMGLAQGLIIAKISATGCEIDEPIKTELFELADEIYNWFHAKEQL